MSVKEVNKRGEILLLDPDKVVLNEEKNGRLDPHDDDAINELVQSFKDFGQLQPVVGRRTVDKGIEIILGFRRTQAMRKLNEELLQTGNEPMLLKVGMAKMNDMEAFKANIVENRHRKQTTALDDAHNQNVLRAKHNMNNNEIAAFYQMTPSRVSQISRLLTLSEDIKRKVNAGQITMGDAFALTELSEDQQLEVVKEQEEENRKFYEEEQEGKAVIVPSEVHNDNVARTDAAAEEAPKKKPGRPKGTGKGIKDKVSAKTGKKKTLAGGKPDKGLQMSDMVDLLEGCMNSTEVEGVKDICAFFLSYCNYKAGTQDVQKALEAYCEENMAVPQAA